MSIAKLAELDLRNKRLLIRLDLNVPIADGRVGNDARIKASLPTIKMALAGGAAVILMSHLGRPKAGTIDANFSLAPVAEVLQRQLQRPVRLQNEWLNGVEVTPGEVVLCENVRFNLGEKENDDELSKKIATLADVFVMDAFGSAHRAHASTHGVARYAPKACMGPLLAAELDALNAALAEPRKPMVAIVGGSKVSTKLQVLESLIEKVDQLIVGGGIANTFLAAQGHDVGASLYEPDLVATAAKLLERARQSGKHIPLPSEVVCSTHFAADAKAEITAVNAVSDKQMILDFAPKSATEIAAIISGAGTIVWNGPLGVFEFDAFAEGTKIIAEAIGNSNGFSIAGGGDTIAAIDKFGVRDQISYISTGGGAFLQVLEGKDLPAVEVLRRG